METGGESRHRRRGRHRGREPRGAGESTSSRRRNGAIEIRARFVRSTVQSWLNGAFAPAPTARSQTAPVASFSRLSLRQKLTEPVTTMGIVAVTASDGYRRRQARLQRRGGGLLSSVGHRPFTVGAPIGQVERREPGARGRHQKFGGQEHAVETVEETVSWKMNWRDPPRGRTSPVWKRPEEICREGRSLLDIRTSGDGVTPGRLWRWQPIEALTPTSCQSTRELPPSPNQRPRWFD
jgi:hypothetical protein